MEKSAQEIESLGGRITHQFTDKVLVAELPDDVDPQSLKKSKLEAPRSLDAVSQLAVDAWNAKQLKSRSRSAASARAKPLSWDAPGYEPPLYDKTGKPVARSRRSAGEKIARSTGTPTSLVLEGSVAVGVVVVSSTQPGLQISAVENAKIFAEVQEGLDFLAKAEPNANVSFVYDVRFETVSVPPSPMREISVGWRGWPASFASNVEASVMWNNDKAFFFKGNQYLRYDVKTDKVDAGYPKPIAGNWKGFPASFAAGIDAAVMWNNGKAYFFKGSEYIRFDVKTDKTDAGYPKPIAGNWKGFPASFATGIDAAVAWKDNKKAYFFKGSEYIRFDIAADKTDSGYPLPITGNWKGWPASFAAGVDTGILWNNGIAYFFKDNFYIRHHLADDSVDSGYDVYEVPWRDAALQQMGFADTTKYVKSIQAAKGTKWAYAAYFTKYPLNHFAYAINDKLVMHYDNDGWGTDSINTVFAHETCHIFGADDEYAASKCVCGSLHGQLQFPNNNCVNCPGAHIPCLMDANVLSLCVWSRGQIGWNYGLSKLDAAALWNNGKAYFFDGGFYSRYDVLADKTDTGYPRNLDASNWPGWPASFKSGIDASVVWNNGKAYFFKGDQYIRYDMKTDKVESGYPKKITGNWPGFTGAFAAGIDAVVVWNNGKAYFFKGDQYLRYDMKTDKVDAGWPKKISGNWTGFPAAFNAGVDAAVAWNNGKAYFFKGDDYVRYDMKTDKVDAGWPKKITANWPGLVKMKV
jgi:hypothetical protein